MRMIRRSTYTLREISELCHVSVATVVRWNRYHGLKADACGNVHRDTLLRFVRRTGQTELFDQI